VGTDSLVGWDLLTQSGDMAKDRIYMVAQMMEILAPQELTGLSTGFTGTPERFLKL